MLEGGGIETQRIFYYSVFIMEIGPKTLKVFPSWHFGVETIHMFKKKDFSQHVYTNTYNILRGLISEALAFELIIFIDKILNDKFL